MQGLTLAVPEMEPFRLTQNLVDAFGVSGVEGAYLRACEVTLQVSILTRHKSAHYHPIPCRGKNDRHCEVHVTNVVVMYVNTCSLTYALCESGVNSQQ